MTHCNVFKAWLIIDMWQQAIPRHTRAAILKKHSETVQGVRRAQAAQVDPPAKPTRIILPRLVTSDLVGKRVKLPSPRKQPGQRSDQPTQRIPGSRWLPKELEYVSKATRQGRRWQGLSNVRGC